jgi:hypothetical protein
MASNSMLTPAGVKKHKGHKGGKHGKNKTERKPLADITPKDDSFDRNFTRSGSPKLSASSDDKRSMGGRR